MAIVIHTDYDPVSTVLSACAQYLVGVLSPASTTELGPTGGGSNKANVVTQLAALPHERVYFYGHGQNGPLGMKSQDQQLFADTTSIHLMHGREIVGQCCYSDQILTQGIAAGLSFVGYQGRLGVPLDPAYFSDFRDCMAVAPTRLENGMGTATAHTDSVAELRMVARRLQSGSTADRVTALFVFRHNANIAVQR